MAEESRIRSAITARTQSAASGEVEYKYNLEKLEQENRYKVDEFVDAFPEKLNKFNWGACILPPIWGLCNNSPIACLTILLGLIPYIGCFLVIGFSIYCGIKGNEWAWHNKEWVDMKQFHEVQRKWAFGAIIVELVFFIITIVGVLIFVDQILKAAQ